MLYEKMHMLADNLEVVADGLEAVQDANPGVILAYRVIAEILRHDLEAEDCLFKDIAEFTNALSGLSQAEPNVGARTAYSLVVGRLEHILREHA